MHPEGTISRSLSRTLFSTIRPERYGHPLSSFHPQRFPPKDCSWLGVVQRTVLHVKAEESSHIWDKSTISFGFNFCQSVAEHIFCFTEKLLNFSVTVYTFKCQEKSWAGCIWDLPNAVVTWSRHLQGDACVSNKRDGAVTNGNTQTHYLHHYNSLISLPPCHLIAYHDDKFTMNGSRQMNA